jgi:hypothetical protein
MSRKPRVQRTPKEKWQIVLESLKSGNVAQTCRKYEIAPNLLEVLPFGSRGTGLTLTTDNGTQFTSARYGRDFESAGHHASLPLTTTPRATATSRGFIAA